MKPFVTLSPLRIVQKTATMVIPAAILAYFVVTYRYALSFFLGYYGLFIAILLVLALDSAHLLLFSAYRIEVGDEGMTFRTLTGHTFVPIGRVSAVRPSYLRPQVAVLVHSTGTVFFSYPFPGFHTLIRAVERLNPGAVVSEKLLEKGTIGS
jgi:hypothetical protein